MMLIKSGKVSVGGGEAGKKTKTTPDTGGKSVSEKSQTTRTCRETLRRMVLSSSSSGWSDLPLEKDDTWQPVTGLCFIMNQESES